MNKPLIVAFSKLLNIEESVIETAIADQAGNDSIVVDFLKDYKPYKAVELATLIDNAKKKYLEDVQVPDIPKATYLRIATSFLEPKEKAIAAKHGIDKYDNLDDLIFKVSEKLTSGKGNHDETLKKDIEALKEANKTLLKEKEEGIKAAEEKYNGELTSLDLSTALKSLPLDYEDDEDEKKSVLKKQRTLVDSTFNSLYKVERREGNTVVLGTDGKPVVDHLGSPKKVSDVMSELAAEYGFKLKTTDPGNRGLPGSAPNTGGSGLKGKTEAEAYALKGVNPTQSGEAKDAVYAEWIAANPKT